MAKLSERLGLLLPHEDDVYDIQEFNGNSRIIDREMVRVPQKSGSKSLLEFIESGESAGYRRGDTVIIDQIMYIMTGNNALEKESFMPYGPEALVIMRYYLTPDERIKGSLYLQISKKRKLIIKVYEKYIGSLPVEKETNCLYFDNTDERTSLVNDENTYRFTCKNLRILKEQSDSNRKSGELYFIPDNK